ncbi:hypothetical protein ACLB1G_23285 [Oxalobacteraceae bacterium A2-2]
MPALLFNIPASCHHRCFFSSFMSREKQDGKYDSLPTGLEGNVNSEATFGGKPRARAIPLAGETIPGRPVAGL